MLSFQSLSCIYLVSLFRAKLVSALVFISPLPSNLIYVLWLSDECSSGVYLVSFQCQWCVLINAFWNLRFYSCYTERTSLFKFDNQSYNCCIIYSSYFDSVWIIYDNCFLHYVCYFVTLIVIYEDKVQNFGIFCQTNLMNA